MADTCSKVIVGNEGYSKAALRQMLGNMMDLFQSTGEVDIPALGNFLNQLVDTMPDASPISEIEPGTVGPPDLGGEELGDESNVRLEYSACPEYVEEYPLDSCSFPCGTVIPTPRRLRIWMTRGVQRLYTNIPLLVYDDTNTPCRPPTWTFMTLDISGCTTTEEEAAIEAASVLYTNTGVTVGALHTPGTPWSSGDLDTLALWVQEANDGFRRVELALIKLIKDQADYYDFEQYGWCGLPDFG